MASQAQPSGNMLSHCCFDVGPLSMSLAKPSTDIRALYGCNGNVLVKTSPEIQIVTDTSPSGYGATCLGILDSIYSQHAPNDGYF